MKEPAQHMIGPHGQRERGFTLIELMIAITLGLFLIGGLLMMVQSTRNAFGNQQLLAQLQDNERLVMTFMAEVTESAGYFPDPVHNSYTSMFLALSPIPHGAQSFVMAGQTVFGTFNAAAPGDTVSIRYAAAANDNVFNCKGTINTTGATDIFVNTFWVNNANPNNPVLTCTVSSANGAFPNTDIPLVNGVQNLTILYGVKRNVNDTGSCADTYLTAAQMAPVLFPNDWLNVCSVQVQMFFTNPITPAGPPIKVQRTIATMVAAGVNS
jgi:type IV pilus assembly protein PilW